MAAVEKIKASKRVRAYREKLTKDAYGLDEAIDLVKECATAKFVEAVDVAIRLGIDARKSDQGIRGATVLPNGTGREVRVAVLAQGAPADAGKKAGADIVGFEDLAETILKGEINFDVLIATPDAMRVVGKLGQILGPKGLMPNPKVGTVTADVATAVNNAKRGQVQFRSDKNGIVHVSIGKADFEAKKLAENFRALLADLRKAKPASAKGTYIKKVVLSSTMGPAVHVDRSSLAETK